MRALGWGPGGRVVDHVLAARLFRRAFFLFSERDHILSGNEGLLEQRPPAARLRKRMRSLFGRQEKTGFQDRALSARVHMRSTVPEICVASHGQDQDARSIRKNSTSGRFTQMPIRLFGLLRSGCCVVGRHNAVCVKPHRHSVALLTLDRLPGARHVASIKHLSRSPAVCALIAWGVYPDVKGESFVNSAPVEVRVTRASAAARALAKPPTPSKMTDARSRLSFASIEGRIDGSKVVVLWRYFFRNLGGYVARQRFAVDSCDREADGVASDHVGTVKAFRLCADRDDVLVNGQVAAHERRDRWLANPYLFSHNDRSMFDRALSAREPAREISNHSSTHASRSRCRGHLETLGGELPRSGQQGA